MKFTDRSIAALKPKSDRYEAWEDNGKGFGLRVSPKGLKTWVFMYRFDGKARRMTLGTYPKISLAKANTEHAAARELLDHGIDPGQKQVQANSDARRAPTVKHLADEYLEKWARPRKRSWKEDERILEKDILPEWGSRKAAAITRRDIISLLDDIIERGAPIAANRTLAVIRKMFNFAVGRDIVSATPCTAIPSPSQENRRDRVLTESEIKDFWTGLERAKMTEGLRLALKLQLVTAQRIGEIVQAAWDELDLESGWWTIPADKSKNKITHRVPLSSQALDVLSQIKALVGDSIWLFPAPGGKKPITPDSLSRALRRNDSELGMEHFTPHDLRRTAASLMTGMGISRLVVSKLLNHVESGITAVYDRHSYDKEKRQALETWGRKLHAIINRTDTDKNIVPIRAQADSR